MNNELVENKDMEQKKKNQKAEESFRIAVNKKADDEIIEMLPKINSGFTAGKVNRPQLVCWIISKFSESLNDSTIKSIRADHFDEFTLFESIMRQAKESGKFPPEFKALMQKYVNNDEPTSKRTKGKIDNELHQ